MLGPLPNGRRFGRRLLKRRVRHASVSNTGKTVDAFRTISEVAEELDLPQSVLRYWETRFGQIRPVKRAGGRRFYRPDDVDLLRGIRQLLYNDGYTINGVQKILKDQGIRFVQDVGVERAAAVMRTDVPPAPHLDPAPERQDGTTFGGILGLLPRRRKTRDDDPLPALPQAVELPLPFPDADADRDLATHPDGPAEPFAPRARPEGRREPTLEARPAAPRPSPERGRLEPTLGPQPVQRPMQDAPPDPAFDDPDDDFGDGFDFDAVPEAALYDEPEPLSDPRRMRAAADGAGFQQGAPRSEDRPARPPHPEAEPPRPAPSFAAREPAPRAIMPLQRPSRGPAAHISHHGAAPELDDPLLPFMEPAGMNEDRPDFSAVSEPIEERIRRLKAQVPQPARTAYGRPSPGAGSPHPDASDFHRAEAPPHWRGDDRSYFDPAPGGIAPDHGPLPDPAGTDPQWGPGPAQGSYPEEERVFAPLSRLWQERPAPQDRAQAWPASSRYAAAPSAPAGRGWPTAPAAPPEAGLYGMPRGGASPGESPASPADFPAIVRRAPAGGAAFGSAGFEAPFGGAPAAHGHAASVPPQPALRMPPEPIRHGPAEQYLPPHLRGEPRLAGQPVMAAPAPVLSRDDIYRLQAALYELGECRRLMDDALGGGLDAAGEAGPG